MHALALQAVIWDGAAMLPAASEHAADGWDIGGTDFIGAAFDLVAAVRQDRAIRARKITPNEVAGDLTANLHGPLTDGDYQVAELFAESNVVLALFTLIHPPGTVPCLFCTVEGRDAPRIAPGAGGRLCAEHGGHPAGTGR
ncbi:hypothetical protein [Parafrankia sp. EUN1f]|uniref:hypothetical protein n=1 Tax=Parafrankia sp. EUN1f TaxID=102897 RepID=UPI00030FF140|nr:hypothetical protein [Parafrankia sp. EUN1f]